MFTLTIMVMSACCFAFGFEYVRIVTWASNHGFVDSPEGNGPIYRGIMKGFNNAFDKCEPVAYRTDDVISACRARLADADATDADVEALEECAGVEPDLVYIYCKGRPEPWEMQCAPRRRTPAHSTATPPQ